MKTLREGYTETVKDFTVEKGVRNHYIERTITAPSGNQYLISNPYGGVRIEDVNHFEELGFFRNHPAAYNQIYEWEDNEKQVLPNLKDSDYVLSLLNVKGSCKISSAINAKKLIDIGIINPTLQTAVYLYESLSRTGIGNNAVLDMKDVLKNIPLSFDDSVKFCNYVINKNPDCAKGIPNELLVKCIKENITDKMFSKNSVTINQEWLNSPEWSDDFEKEAQSNLDKNADEELDRDF